MPNRSQTAWTQAYRAIEHDYASRQCGKKTIDKFPSEIQDFASKFQELQEKRHSADYDPSFRLTCSEALTEIHSAEIVIKKLQASPSKDRTAFAVWTAMKKRPE